MANRWLLANEWLMLLSHIITQPVIHELMIYSSPARGKSPIRRLLVYAHTSPLSLSGQ